MRRWPRIGLAVISLGCLTLGACLLSAAQAQDDSAPLTPRQLFFTTRPANPTPAAVQSPATPAQKPKPRPRVQAAKPAPATGSPAPSSPVETESKAVSVPYLGLRYSILDVDAHGNNPIEVDSQSVFRSGEHFLLSLESNDAAYLYVVLQASQGSWQVLFPRLDIRNGDNYIAAHNPVLLPSSSRPFFFDEHPGTEHLFVVLSRQPEPDLDQLIPIVQQRQSGTGENAARPGNVPAAPMTMASADVNRVRDKLASRGIQIEQETAEKAVYTVNANRSENSRVITDIVLKHE